jgi:hypothetical protein
VTLTVRTVSSRHVLPGSSSQQAAELGNEVDPGHKARDDNLAVASETEH